MSEFFPRIQFVSGPSADAEVRLDLNDLTRYPEHTGFTLGAPKFSGSVDAINPQLGFRQVRFNFIVDDDEYAYAAVMSALSRELMRPRNWILVQRSLDTAPGFIHTYASAPDDVSWEQARNGDEGAPKDTWQVGLTIDADAGIKWKRRDQTFTVSNNPSTGGCFHVLEDVAGDLPVPVDLRIEVAQGKQMLRPVVNITACDDPSYTPTVSGNLSWVGADAPVSNAAYASGHYIETNSGSVIANVQVPVPDAGPGRYRVMARMAATATSDVWQLQVLAAATDFTATFSRGETKTIVTQSAGELAWYDLGILQLPGADADLVSQISYIHLLGSRQSGTGQLRFDDLIQLLPVSGDDFYADTTFLGPGTFDVWPSAYVLHGADRKAWQIEKPSSDWGNSPTPLVTGFPRVRPGKTNVVHLLLNVEATVLGSDALATTTDVTVSYQPEGLFLPDEISD